MSATRRQLLVQVAKIRRRAVLVLAVEQASAVSIWCLTAAALAAMAWGTTLPWTWTIGVAALLAAALAGALTLLRWPSRAAIARLLDRRLHLDERVETAVELADQRDEISLLIQLDAIRHLQPVEARAVIPWRWRGSVLIAVGALALIAVGSLALGWLAAPVGKRSVAASGAISEPGGARSPRAAGTEAPHRGDEGVASRGRGGAGAGRQPTASRTASAPAPERPPPGRSESRSRPFSADESATAAGGGPRARSVGAADSGAGAAAPAPTAPGDEWAAPAAAAAAAAGPPPGRGTPGAAGGVAGRPGAGLAGAAGGAAAQEGGARLSRASTVPAAGGEMPPGGLELPGQAAAAAPAALALERLPPGMELYVRNYLRALSQPGQP